MKPNSPLKSTPNSGTLSTKKRDVVPFSHPIEALDKVYVSHNDLQEFQAQKSNIIGTAREKQKSQDGEDCLVVLHFTDGNGPDI